MNQSMQIEEILQQNGFYISTTVGTSMYPMMRNRQDTIVIRPVTQPLRKYDVPLYKRQDDYVLHRIVRVTPKGYVICGDNCLNREYGITDQQIIGVLSEFIRGEKEVDMNSIGYKNYCRIWISTYPVRYLLKTGYILLKKLLKG